MTACPSSSKAAVNLARAYETLDNREAAIRYYRAAANGTDSDARSAKDAKAALSCVKRIPFDWRGIGGNARESRTRNSA